MRLTRQTNLAVRMLMYCAANDGRLSQIFRIGGAFNVSQLHLAQISKPLVDAGLLATVRGRGGGVRLGRPAHLITLAEVVQVMEAMTSHVVGRTEDEAERALQNAFDAFLDALSRVTVAELANGMPGLKGMIDVA
jgi:Rrf2 family iron-responsive transcriptional regulator